LEQTPRLWRFDGGYLRSAGNHSRHCCPITAVAKGYDSIFVWECAADLQLYTPSAARIINAADKRKGFDRAIRARLLKACGLS
jgi:hypothetical protein